MANIKSAQKQARQNIVRRQRNLARRTAIKTAIRKVLEALETDPKKAQEFFVDAESKLARAKGKGVINARAASRKISRLAKRLATKARATA
jgi:small subunit ribosomal protein S20